MASLGSCVAAVVALVKDRADKLVARIGQLGCMLISAALTISGAQAEVISPDVVPGYRIELPRDEGSHPQFKTEWWYVTGWLEDTSGAPLGFQLTFFRSRTGIDGDNPSRFALRQVLFAHLAVSDPKRGALLHHEKSARPGFGLAAAKEGSLDVYIDDWQLRRDGDTYIAVAKANDLQLNLKLQPKAPPLLQGDAGFSQKGPNPNSASYYYSLPQLAVTGSVSIEGKERAVKGRAWFDHEWSGAIVDERAQGWDWIGLNLDDGGALMMFQMRGPNDSELWAAAKYRAANSTEAVSYKPDDIEWKPLRHWRSDRTGVRYPVEWQVTVGTRVITLRPLMDDQENDASGSTGTIYWEGAVLAYEADKVIGRGYLELTGYGKKMRL
ncbi:carotenoid 1,2-hydratase [Steroidobacter sp.]|uniref:lipocalin-like domain-containing protein n=1 Tax=Steroidobacter sp. TaxID=1978227 RepID=UPI001A478AE6|nr:carotenoid 1,2-hydratase [Steroidobacter sp.]MBL8272044.1 carotenoid 1,2-hydratase [Steroidobacter sp.]